MATEEETMRIVAEVVDKFSKPLREMREGLRGVSTSEGQKRLQQQFRGLRDEIEDAKKTIVDGLSPALGGLNIRALTVGGAIGAVAVAVGRSTFEVARNVERLRLISGSSGVGVNSMRALGYAIEEVGGKSEQIAGSVQGFARNMKELRAGVGGTLSELFKNGDANVRNFALSLRSVGSNDEALNLIIKFLDRISNPIDKQRFVEAFGLPAEMAGITAKQWEENQKKTARVSKDMERDAEVLSKAWRELGRSWDNLQVETAKAGGFGIATTLLDGFSDAIKAVGRDLKMLWQHDWEGLSKPDPGRLKTLLQLQMTSAQHRLQKLDEGIAQNQQSGMAGTGYAELERKKLIEEIEKLRKAIEENNRDVGLQKQGLRGSGGFGGGGIIPAMYSGGGASSGGFGRGSYGGGVPSGMGRVGGIGEGLPGENGAGLQGSDYLRARRAGMAAEIEKTPGLRKQLAGMLALEGTPLQTMESLANRTEYMNAERAKRGLPPLSLQQMLHSGFYGPINRGQLPGAIAQLERDPKRMQRFSAAIDAVVKGGSNTVQGATDQGMPSDPNGRWAGGGFRLHFGGNIFNDWGGAFGHDAARSFREAQQRAVREGGSSEIGAAGNRGRMFDAARDAGITGFPTQIQGGARVQIDLNGFPRGTTTKADAHGVFSDIELNRGRVPTSIDDGLRI